MAKRKRAQKNQGLLILGYAITIIGILIIGGLALFIWQRQGTTNNTAANATNNQANNETNNAANTVNNQTTTTTDNRTLVTLENAASLQPAGAERCNVQFNLDKPNTTVNYSNEKFGLSIEIPYNSNWGNTQYRIEPYELTKVAYQPEQMVDDLEFGPISLGEGCGWNRQYSLMIIPQRSVQKALEGIKTEMGGLTFMVDPSEVSINGKKAIKYVSSGLCAKPAFEVIGQKYNYVLGPLCGGDYSEEFTFFEGIVRTLEFI